MLLASGELDRPIASLVRHCDRAMILCDTDGRRIACTRIGGPLLFGRLWERLGIAVRAPRDVWFPLRTPGDDDSQPSVPVPIGG